MELGKPIKGIGVGLGKHPTPHSLALQGGGGTATVNYDAGYANTLMAIHGTISDGVPVTFPSDARGAVSSGNPDTTSVMFAGVRIIQISPPVGGIVEVTLHYDSVQRVTSVATGPNFGDNTRSRQSGGTHQGGHIVGTNSNIKNNIV